MDTDKLLSSRWLSGADVEPFVDWTVEAITQEEVGRDKELKTILWFTESDKGMVCNRTNLRNLINILGKGDTDNWKGKQIQLYATTQEFGGEEYNVVRVRPVQPAGRTKPAATNGKPAPSAAPVQLSAHDKLAAFMTKNGLTDETLAALVKSALGTDTIAAWVKADMATRNVDAAITKLQEMHDLDNFNL